MGEPATARGPRVDDAAASSVIVVPIGEMDHFSAARLVEAATLRIEELGEPDRLVVDLSALSFCDSSVGQVLEWAAGMPEHVDVALVSGGVSDRVIELFPREHRPRIGSRVR